jgi:hypothetical protein
MYLKPTAGCQISTLIFGFWRVALYISHEKMPTDGKVLPNSCGLEVQNPTNAT